MKVFVGADHRGVLYKAKIMQILNELKYDAVDLGSYDSKASCDYPKIGYAVAKNVASSKSHRGILVCMSGIGQSIVANKVRGAYAALCYNAQAVKLSRQHNNANVLVLSSRFIKAKDLKRIIKLWLTTEFEGGRHERRVNQVKKVEQGRKP